MKSTSATFFVFLYLLAMVRPVMPLFEYVIDQDYIAEFLCINKKRVEVQCNGKCYLMQRLNQQNDEKKQNLPRIAIEEYPIGFVNFILLKPPKDYILKSDIYPSITSQYNFLFSGKSYRPPMKAT